MTLFAHRREYQRSIDRVFEDFSDHPQSQAEASTGGKNAPIQHDCKSWGHFLESKRNEQSKFID